MEKHDVKGTLNVVGEGDIKAKPDVAILDLGVVTENKSAREAVSENAARMSKLIARVKGLGVPEADIQTVGFNISPITDWDDKSVTYGQIIRYRVEDTVSVRADPEKAGSVIDEAMAGGANMGGQLAFGFRDEAVHRKTAMVRAMQAAMREAELIASTMKVEIHGITSLSVSHGGQAIYRRALKSAEAATPIEAGTLTVSALASVTYSIASRR